MMTDLNTAPKKQRGRPAVISGKAMVLFRNNENEIFTKWRIAKKSTQEERDILGVTTETLGISDAIRLLIIKGMRQGEKE